MAVVSGICSYGTSIRSPDFIFNFVVHESSYYSILYRLCWWRKINHEINNHLTPELNPSAQRCLPRFLLGILIFKGLTVRRLYKSFGVKGLSHTKTNIVCVTSYYVKIIKYKRRDFNVTTFHFALIARHANRISVHHITFRSATA
jgi:hypothetical protein